MTWHSDASFNDLPELPPARDLEIETGPQGLHLGPGGARGAERGRRPHSESGHPAHTLPVLEAQASSEIENIVTTTDRLFQFATDEAAQADAATKKALRYRTALRRGLELLMERPVSTNVAVEVCWILREIETQVRKAVHPSRAARSPCVRGA